MLVALRNVPDLDYVDAGEEVLRLGAMTTHRAVERSEAVREGWPSLASAFSAVASPRVRNQATVGGVVADADYASDPPSMLAALDARVVARSVGGQREIPMDEFIVGHYETALDEDELVTELRIPRSEGRSVYRKFRSRSSEDRPCVSVAAARENGGLRVVVGAVAERPQYFPEVCDLARDERIDGELAAEIGRRYAEEIEPLSDSRGSARYRRRVIAVEVRRALEDLGRD
jgi:carbon-monoxide dehydrogenase medium subunit